MTKKNIFAVKSFLSLNISDFIFYVRIFENLVGGSTSPQQKGGRRRGVQGCKDQRWLRGRERERKLCYDTYMMLFCCSYTESLVLWFPWFYVDWQSCCTSFWTDINKKTVIQANSPFSYMVLYWTVIVTVKVTLNMSRKFTFLFNYLPPTFIQIEENATSLFRGVLKILRRENKGVQFPMKYILKFHKKVCVIHSRQ